MNLHYLLCSIAQHAHDHGSHADHADHTDHSGHDHSQEANQAIIDQALARLAEQPEESTILPAVLAALTISLLGGALSIFVVLKRLAFIGQGISHAAFGGVGIALVLGVHGTTTTGTIAQLSIVTAFSILAALWIAALSRSNTRTDTAIGVVLSASMALGFVLFTFAESQHDHDAHGHAAPGHEDQHHLIEEILFGNILATDATKATVAITIALLLLALTWFIRRSLIFWSLDEPVMDAYGQSSRATSNTFLSILAVAIVLSMQIAGVVLAAAMLVLPGATALNLTSKLKPAFLFAITLSLLAVAIGFPIAQSIGSPTGPTIVLVQSIFYLITQSIRLFATR